MDRRIYGLETEYGVAVPGQPASGAMVASSQIVNGWASGMADGPARSRRTRWDFEEENPLRDARGFDVGAGMSDHELEDDLGLANVILTNGARLYVDHAHPEYSSPEVTTALDVVRFDKAGDKVMALAAQRAGLTNIYLPQRNEPDLDDVPADILGDLRVHIVSDVREILEKALEPAHVTGAVAA